MIKDNVEFFVNEEKKVVVCKYRFQDLFPLIQDIEEEMGYSSGHEWLDRRSYILECICSIHYKKLEKSQLVAKAVCCSSDDFNIRVGKIISYNKLRLKMFNYLLREIDSLGSTLFLVTYDLARKRDKAYQGVEHY